MPRTKRLLCDEGVFHVINRGHNKQFLFNDDEDFSKFKDSMKIYINKYNIELFNYCLMFNHFHLLVKIKKANHLPVVIKGVCQSYAHYHRKKYNRRGYLFQNRYKSIPIDKNEYLLECARYIERNPLRNNLVKDLSEYRWSSYNYYANGQADYIITPNLLYNDFGATSRRRRLKYIQYLTESRPYEALLDKAIKEMH